MITEAARIVTQELGKHILPLELNREACILLSELICLASSAIRIEDMLEDEDFQSRREEYEKLLDCIEGHVEERTPDVFLELCLELLKALGDMEAYFEKMVEEND